MLSSIIIIVNKINDKKNYKTFFTTPNPNLLVALTVFLISMSGFYRPADRQQHLQQTE